MGLHTRPIISVHCALSPTGAIKLTMIHFIRRKKYLFVFCDNTKDKVGSRLAF